MRCTHLCCDASLRWYTVYQSIHIWKSSDKKPMDIHEYQAKQLLKGYGVPVLPGGVAYTAEEAERVARELAAESFAVKAQILAGGRGKVGAVRLVNSTADVRETAARIIGSTVATEQTGGREQRVLRVYVEEACDIVDEFFVGLLVDRTTARVTVIGSRRGGVGVEEVAAGQPDSVLKVAVDPLEGLLAAQAREMAVWLDPSQTHAGSLEQCLLGLYAAFTELDAALIELNPLVVTRAGQLVALDAKMSFDDNALFRHKNIADLRDADAEEGRVLRAQEGYNYIKLPGNIGCMVNGAALAMATMDSIKGCGGEPANFLDVPPSAPTDRITAAFKRVLTDPEVAVIVVNVVGGGITRCDTVAEGMANAYRAAGRRVPLVVRFEGTNRDLGKKTLRDTGVPFVAADTLAEAAARAVARAAETAERQAP